MLTIALTGGIGSGKSTVAELFAKKQIPIIDADVIAHQQLENTAIINACLQHFGKIILNPAGQIDRKQLRQHVFNNPDEKQWLEHLLHPVIADVIRHEVQHITGPYVILVIPLLFETQEQLDYDRILVVDTSEALQQQRTCQRDQISPTLTNKILNSQVSRQIRLENADDIIDNSKDLTHLEQQIEQLHQKYCSLANGSNAN